jgi:hypothetical protein
MDEHTCGYEHDATMTCDEAEAYWNDAWEWEARAEAEAEMRNERFWEDRGYWEGVAEEEWERSRGVIPFHVAMAEAEAAAARTA